MNELSVPLVVLSARQDDAELVNKALREAGHRSQCHWSPSVEALDESLPTVDPHLILYFADTLDADPAEVAAVRRRYSSIVPLLVVRNQVDEDTIAAALSAGAQDLVSARQRERLKAVASRELRTFRLERALNRTLESASHYKAQLKSFMAGSVDAIADVQEGIVVDANQAWADLLGHRSPETTHGPIMDFVDAGSQAALKGALLASLKGKWDGTQLKVAALRREGGRIPIEIGLEQSLFDGEPATKLIVRRQPEQQPEPEQIVEQSVHADPVTGWNSRRHFLELVDKRLIGPLGAGARALALIRIDKFREIADQVGPVACEEVVAQIAETTRGLLGAQDVSGRFGGTTLAVLIERGALRDIQAWAEHVVGRVGDLMLEAAGKSMTTTVTVGVAEIGPDTEKLEPLIRAAEKALREGRKLGGDRVVVEEASDESTQIRRFDALWTHQIRSALVENRFRLVHLGIATLNGAAGKMLDTVLRMIDQQGDEVPAAKFMESARRNGLARPIDRWVIGSSIAFCANHDCDVLFVKLSEDSIGDGEIVDWIMKQCAERSVDPRRLCVQVSETDATQFLKQTQVLRAKLGKAGVRFALEHFGVGRDPMRLLSQLPADYIKIDGSLMQSIGSDARLQDVVKSYVAAARQGKFATIAERVDDANTMAVLFQLGVSYIQGHYVHEPEVVLSEAT